MGHDRMMRPFNGPCPYCGEDMVLRMHTSSWVSGMFAGTLTGIILWLVLR